MIYDLAGKLVVSTKPQAGQVDVSALAAGVYTISIRVDGELFQQQLMKK
jgi:hypothetical protein